jgi:hypothetical protein
MKRTILSILLLAIFKFAFSQYTDPLEVKYTDAWDDAEIATLAKQIAETPFPVQKVELVKKAMRTKPLGFTPTQTVTLIKAFETSKNKVQGIQAMDDHILGMTSKQVVEILNTLIFPKDKLDVLDVIRSCITDEENKYQILDAIAINVDKPKAKAILDRKTTPRSFVYGTVTSKNVVFVVDISGSMEAIFDTNTGKNFSRLKFVKQELSKALGDLAPDAKFNIIIFESGVQSWKSDMVEASKSNIQAARDYIDNLRSAGATNIYDAMETAFRNSNAQTIYFLTDGTPTSGKKTSQSDILNDISSWNSGGKVIIHTTAFLMGEYSGEDKATSKAFMKEIASRNNGIFRAIE